MFDQDEERFATLGLAAKLPSAVIDGIWDIIDQNLKGVVRLPRVLQFALIARNGQVTVAFDAHTMPSWNSIYQSITNGSFPRRWQS